MTMGRMIYSTIIRRPFTVILFRFLACLFLGVGVSFIVSAVFLCVDITDCPKDTSCVCQMKTGLVLSALISK